MTWPAVPVVARAYIDQLNRSGALSEEQNAELGAALDRADALIASGGRDRGVSRELQALRQGLGDGGDAQTQKRRTALGDTLDGIARKIR